MRKRHRPIYAKTYAEIISLTYFGAKAGICQSVKSFTPEEWQIARYRPGKRRYYSKGAILKVLIRDSGEIVEIDPAGYQGKKGGYDRPGAVIKMYQKPQSSRLWLFKMIGE